MPPRSPQPRALHTPNGVFAVLMSTLAPAWVCNQVAPGISPHPHAAEGEPIWFVGSGAPPDAFDMWVDGAPATGRIDAFVVNSGGSVNGWGSVAFVPDTPLLAGQVVRVVRRRPPREAVVPRYGGRRGARRRLDLTVSWADGAPPVRFRVVNEQTGDLLFSGASYVPTRDWDLRFRLPPDTADVCVTIDALGSDGARRTAATACAELDRSRWPAPPTAARPPRGTDAGAVGRTPPPPDPEARRRGR